MTRAGSGNGSASLAHAAPAKGLSGLLSHPEGPKQEQQQQQQQQGQQQQAQEQPALLDLDELIRQVGPGPARFAPAGNHRSEIALRPLQDQVDALTEEQWETYLEIGKRWDSKRDPHFPADGDLLMRYFRSSNYDAVATWVAVKRCRASRGKRYLEIRAADLKDQLLTKTLFPLPGLTTRVTPSRQRECPVFYMKPSRFVPNSMSTGDVIDNLAYVMRCSVEESADAQESGVAFVANMNDWTIRHFTTEYCKLLQRSVSACVCV